MERYKSKFKRDPYDYIHAIGRFKETVVHVQKYLDILKDELLQLKRELKFYKGDTLQLFNERFYHLPRKTTSLQGVDIRG